MHQIMVSRQLIPAVPSTDGTQQRKSWLPATVAIEGPLIFCAVVVLVQDRPRWPDLAVALPLLVAAGAFVWLTRYRDDGHGSAGRAWDYTLVWTVAAAILLPAGYVACLTVAVHAVRRATPRTPVSNLLLSAWVQFAAALGANVIAGATPLRRWVTGEIAVGHDPATVITMMAACSGIVLTYVAAQVLHVAARGVLTKIRAVTANLGYAGGAGTLFVGSRQDYTDLAKVLALASLAVAAIRVAPLLAVVAVLPVAVHLTRVEHDCETDGLMSVRTKRAITHQGQHAIGLDRAAGRPSSVLMCDIDFFKAWNDTYGHPAGDRLLRAVATAMRTTIRDGDLIGRWGGEEILIVLPDTDSTAATAIGHRLLRAVADMHTDLSDRGNSQPLVTGVGNVPRCTVSIGIATSPDDGTTWSALERVADDAVYAAKAGGRNRLAVAQPREPSCGTPDSGRGRTRAGNFPRERCDL